MAFFGRIWPVCLDYIGNPPFFFFFLLSYQARNFQRLGKLSLVIVAKVRFYLFYPSHFGINHAPFFFRKIMVGLGEKRPFESPHEDRGKRKRPNDDDDGPAEDERPVREILSEVETRFQAVISPCHEVTTRDSGILVDEPEVGSRTYVLSQFSRINRRLTDGSDAVLLIAGLPATRGYLVGDDDLVSSRAKCLLCDGEMNTEELMEHVLRHSVLNSSIVIDIGSSLGDGPHLVIFLHMAVNYRAENRNGVQEMVLNYQTYLFPIRILFHKTCEINDLGSVMDQLEASGGIHFHYFLMRFLAPHRYLHMRYDKFCF